MVRTKNTARKPSAGLPTARRPYVCQHCRHEINDLSNYRRHLAIVHVKKDDGTDADDSTVARYSRYTKRGPRVPVQSAPSADDTSRHQPTNDERRETDDLCPYTVSCDTSPTTWPCQHRRADQRLRPVRPTTCSLISPTKKLPLR